MKRTVIGYAVALAVGALLLQWLEYRLMAKTLPGEAYALAIALCFLALGAWAGARLTHKRPADAAFEPNEAARNTLGISDREAEVLSQLARGLSNKEMARELDISPNTIKTHLASLYAKLEVARRTQAVQRARELGLIA